MGIHYAFFGNVVRGKSTLFRLVVRNGFAHFVWKVFARRKLLPGKFGVFAPLVPSTITPPSHLCSTLPRTSSFVFDNPRWQPHNAPPEIQSGFESLNSLSRIKNVSSGPSKCVKQHKTAVSCSKGSIWGGVGASSARIGFMF